MVNATNMAVSTLLVTDTAIEREPSPLSKPACAAIERIRRAIQIKGIQSESGRLGHMPPVTPHFRAAISRAEYAC